MSLSFLPEEIKSALSHLIYNFISELRLRRDKPVIVEYKGEYAYLNGLGVSGSPKNAIYAGDLATVLNSATEGCIYGYTEQIKNGFITVEHGVRIGIAGEYVSENGRVSTVKTVTSLNIRVPHEINGCSDFLFKTVFNGKIAPTLIYSRPGLGKTTMLREIARRLSTEKLINVLVLDERNEISAMDGYGEGFDLGNADVIRCFNKLHTVAAAIRAMKPDVIITDELYGNDDIKAVEYAAECGIAVIASSHVTDREILKKMPFEFFAELNFVGGSPKIYDKNFNSCGDCLSDNGARRTVFGE